MMAALAALALGAADTQTILSSLEKQGRALKTMQADFVQTRVSVLLNDKEETRGSVLLQVPGRLRWNYAGAQPSAMVIKGGRIERYVPQTKQLFRGTARADADLLVGFGEGAVDLGKKYEVAVEGEEAVAGAPAWILKLKPRGGGGLFKEIRLWVEKTRFIPVQTQLTEPTDDYTTIRFEHVVLNKVLPASAFDLVLPKGVTVEELK